MDWGCVSWPRPFWTVQLLVGASCTHRVRYPPALMTLHHSNTRGSRTQNVAEKNVASNHRENGDDSPVQRLGM
jgi:hypothetical protein